MTFLLLKIFQIRSPRNNQVNKSNFSTRVQSLNATRNSDNNKNFHDQISNQASPVAQTKSSLNVNNINGSIEKDHFYVTRPLLRINKDFIEKPLIKNVQVVSDDLPNWCQSTNKYYTPENIDKTKKSKIVIKKNQDIFGNDIKMYPNNFKFFCEPPSEGQRFEKKRMVIADRQEDSKKTQTKKELMLGKLRLRWDEDVKKQKYEPRLPLKIGHENETPYIKKLEMKRNSSLNEFRKIGEVDQFKRENRDKPVQLKIGHGIPEIINPIKFNLS